MSPVDSPILEDLSRDGIVSRITENVKKKCILDSLSRAAPRECIDQLGHTGRTACPIVKKAPFRWDDTLSCTGREASLGALQSYEQKCYLQTRWPRHSSHQLPLSPQHWVLQVLHLTWYCHHNLLLDSLGNMVLWSLHFFLLAALYFSRAAFWKRAGMPGQPLPGMSSLLLGHNTLQKQPEKLAHSLRSSSPRWGSRGSKSLRGLVTLLQQCSGSREQWMLLFSSRSL